MKIIFQLLYLPFNCFAADRPCITVPKLEDIALEQHAYLLPDCQWVGDWKENAEELFAYAVGCFFASEHNSLVKRISSGGDSEHDILKINYEMFLETFSSLKNGLDEFIKEKLDFDQFQILIVEPRNFKRKIWGSFGELRRFVAECAKDEFAIVAFEVAILKWVVQSLEKGDNPNLFPLTCSTLDLPQALIGLELLPNIARLCRRELDALLDGLVVYYQQMSTIDITLFAKLFNLVVTLGKKSVTEKLMPILMEKNFDPKDASGLFRYIQFLSFNNCPYAARMLKENVQFQNQSQPFNQFKLKLFIDHDPHCNLVSTDPLDCALKSKIEGEYVLQAEIIKGNISWTAKKFVLNYGAPKVVFTLPKFENPHQLYVVCRLKPPHTLAAMLFKECQTEAGLKEMLKSFKFRFAAVAFGVTMFEASFIQNQN